MRRATAGKGRHEVSFNLQIRSLLLYIWSFLTSSCSATPGAPRQRPKVALNFTVESLAVDPPLGEGLTPLVVGTSDGRLLLLKVAFEKGVPTCSMLHEVSVMQVSCLCVCACVCVCVCVCVCTYVYTRVRIDR